MTPETSSPQEIVGKIKSCINCVVLWCFQKGIKLHLCAEGVSEKICAFFQGEMQGVAYVFYCVPVTSAATFFHIVRMGGVAYHVEMGNIFLPAPAVAIMTGCAAYPVVPVQFHGVTTRTAVFSGLLPVIYPAAGKAD
jgi:hypothetical protein